VISSIIINKAKQNHGASFNIKSKVRNLRKKMTEPEKILWSHLRKKKQSGFYFRRQHPYGIYILDFYCFKVNLVVEIDGMIHLSRHAYDIERTKYLKSSGLSVIRFNNNDIETRIDWVIEKIDNYLNNLSPQENIDHFPLGGNKKGGKNK
jgi:very-short-patch-repair endonuclease